MGTGMGRGLGRVWGRGWGWVCIAMGMGSITGDEDIDPVQHLQTRHRRITLPLHSLTPTLIPTLILTLIHTGTDTDIRSYTHTA